MQRKADTSGELVFVVETCQNCKEHHWNTRHDETKYEDFYHKIASAIIQRLPNAVVLRNQIPKSFLPYDLYVNLIPNDDENCPIYDQVPRTGSFEVSYKGMLIFSKLQSGYWPNTQLVGEKCFLLVQDERESRDLKKYFAGNSPTKAGGVKQSMMSRGGRNQASKSPVRGHDQTPQGFSSSMRSGSPGKTGDQKFSQAQAQPGSIMQQQQRQQQEQVRQQPPKQQEPLRQPQVKPQEAQKKPSEKVLNKAPSERQSKFIDPTQPRESTMPPVIQPVAVQRQETPKYSEDNYEQEDFQQQESEPQVQEQEEPTEIEPEKPSEPEPPKDQEMGSHLKTWEDLTDGFPVFPPGTKSLLSKFLTREIWDELKDKVDKHGLSFKSAIFSGCQNVDSGIGVYASSHDTYNSFAPLYDQIVENYHGFKKTDIHHSDMDYTKLHTPPFPEDEAALIKSTRIRVGRNLADFPLGPGLTKEQRLEVEKKVVQAVNTFEGELKGKYYSLGSLSEKDRKQLIDDHFLFKEGDRFLEACGLNRNWPEGRGIFHNDEKSFLVWVNEEDQLRIISMQNGDDIGAVFKRLSQACAHIQTVAKFSHDEHLGYITSCPTNLGTALRASVHIHLPHLGQKKEEFEAIAAKYNVQIRGAHGEHTETDDHIYDISNKRRLGRSEVDLVQDMYNGVKAMIKREKELAPKPEEHDVKCGSHLKKPTDLTGFPTFPEGTKSLLSKFLTKDIWEKLKYQRDAYGFSFRQAIFSGAQNTDSGIGVYAGSHDSYRAFADLFDKIVEHYHSHSKTDKHVSNMDYKQLHAPAFPEDEAKMIKSTRIRVGRNLKGYPLGPGLTKQQRSDIESKVVKALNTFQGELAGKYYSLNSLKEEERKQLIDDHFLFKEGDRFLEACGLNRDWPENRGIFHNNNKTFLVWVNEEDQLRIISMQQGADLGEVFARLSKACAHIETVAEFSHDDHLGYITSCPTNLGTALRASVHIQLPLLGEQKDDFEAIANKYHVQIRGIHGEHSETADHVYDISNKRRLGRSEVDLVQDMYNGVKAMIDKEKELQHQQQASQEEVKSVHNDTQSQHHTEQADDTKSEKQSVHDAQSAHNQSVNEDAKSVHEDSKFDNEDTKSVHDDAKSVHEDAKSVHEDAKSVHEDTKSVHEDTKSVHEDTKSERPTSAVNQSEIQKESDLKSQRSEKSIKPNEPELNQSQSKKSITSKHEAPAQEDDVKSLKSVQSQKSVQSHHTEAKNEDAKSVKGEEDIHKTESQSSLQQQATDQHRSEEKHNIMEETQKTEEEVHQTELPEEAEEQKETICGPHLSTPNDLKAFPKFPEGTKSLLSKNLTPEIWDHLKDAHDKHGFSFKQAIFSGCQNVDSGIGVYAGSHDSYHAFEQLFDKIVEQYHGHGKEDKHVSDMSVDKLNCPALGDDESSMIVSTRIRVGRNLADFPLGPALTREQRKEVEETVVKALSSFEGDLKGTFYSLGSLSEEDRKQLIDDHFLFKEGDRFLEACGLNRDWPEGRGIFHNDAKSFLVWVNEEDQLRIISMQQGSDILKVFDRLSRACAHIEKVAKFAHDDHLGYITSCPTNLGTALRASVHIKLPKLGEQMDEFKKIADKYHVQIRGIHGEHSESSDHVYDISNKRRLGRSEAALVQDMYDGVKALITREKELQ